MSIDYSIFRKQVLNPPEITELQFDFFISAYNQSDRVNIVWDKVVAKRRFWILHEEYGIDPSSLPNHDAIFEGSLKEGELAFWRKILSEVPVEALHDARVAIDITGIMRPHVIALPLALSLAGMKNVYILYSDPSAYVKGTKTKFSIGPVTRTSPVNGFEGVHTTSTAPTELVVVGAGYDDELISAVAESKRSAEHVIMVGLPSLQPHMYQESITRIYKARESITSYGTRTYLYAPAYDPFVTAQVLSDFLHKRRQTDPDVNTYLSPVGPKTQVLGFSWFFLCEELRNATSLIFPYAESYSAETSTGIGRLRIYELELSVIETHSFDATSAE